MLPLTDSERDLVESNRGLAGLAAKRVWVRAHRIPDILDLNQAAMIGLCEAARLFDPGRGIEFSTYASRACYHAALAEAITQGVIVMPRWMGTAARKGHPLLAMGSAARYPIRFEVRLHDRIDPERKAADDRINTQAMLDTLSSDDRELIRRWMRGQTYAEIGAKAGMTPDASRHRIRRAFTAIRRRFGREAG